MDHFLNNFKFWYVTYSYIWLWVHHSYEPPDIKDLTLTQRKNMNLNYVNTR
jgi:hypothetical protein